MSAQPNTAIQPYSDFGYSPEPSSRLKDPRYWWFACGLVVFVYLNWVFFTVDIRGPAYDIDIPRHLSLFGVTGLVLFAGAALLSSWANNEKEAQYFKYPAGFTVTDLAAAADAGTYDEVSQRLIIKQLVHSCAGTGEPTQ